MTALYLTNNAIMAIFKIISMQTKNTMNLKNPVWRLFACWDSGSPFQYGYIMNIFYCGVNNQPYDVEDYRECKPSQHKENILLFKIVEDVSTDDQKYAQKSKKMMFVKHHYHLH